MSSQSPRPSSGQSPRPSTHEPAAPPDRLVSAQIYRAVRIGGWMSVPELQWLADRSAEVPPGSSVVEVGTYLGRSARAIADNLPPGSTLYCVDPYLPYPSEPGVIQDTPTGATLYLQACQNLADLIEDSRVVMWRCTSRTADARFVDGMPALVFLDGDHSYDQVCQDIVMWKSRMAPGGLLCGHDFGRPTPTHEGVTRAVRDAFNTSFTNPVGSIWSVRC